MEDGEEGWTTETIAYLASDLMTFRELEEIEITENGIYGEDVELGAPAYYKVIVNVPTGGEELPEELFYHTGDGMYRFAYGNWNWLIENYGSQITTENLATVSNMFTYCGKLQEIPFSLNFASNAILNNMFANSAYLERIGDMNFSEEGLTSTGIQDLFYGCWRLREVPNMTNFYLTSTNSNYLKLYQMFANCYSLRTIPEFFGDVFTRVDSDRKGSSDTYRGLFNCCYNLDEIVYMPYFPGVLSGSNAFNVTFNKCERLKSFKFKYEHDEIPEAQWKSQLIDLTSVGFGTSRQFLTSGITYDTEVRDDATYQEFKDRDDWWTQNVNYSRYNHDSVVETLENLPDTSAYLDANGGTNTIKFKGASGALTDGGAINTLTEEEIAVATAKGWTVSLV